jgi:hypothetical protein
MIIQAVSEEEAPRTLEAVRESQERPVAAAVVKVERIVREAAEGKAGWVWRAISRAAGMHKHPEAELTRMRPGWMHDVSRHTGRLCSRDWHW